MIPVKKDIDVKGSLGGELHSLTVDAANIPHLMTVLTDLYSDNELAVIREYSTNALDSHKMAGVTRPIEVDLPTPLRPTLRIRDFGLGLSVDEMVKTYGSYGASTKRDDNTVNGCLGLGSKSALTYTSQFVVSAIKNGVRSEIAIYRDPKRGGNIEVVDTQSTDEPNGVTVQVAIKGDVDKLRLKAERFFFYWPKGSVLLDGKEPLNYEDVEGFWLNDKTLILSRHHPFVRDDHSHRVVMGNVPYPETKELGSAAFADYKIVYFADMGEFDFVPSREFLNYTPEATRNLQNLKSRTRPSKIIEYFVKKTEKAASEDEVVDIWTQATKYHAHSYTAQWNGETISTTFPVRNREFLTAPEHRYSKTVYSRSHDQLYLIRRNNYVFFTTDEKLTTLSPALRQKISIWIEKNKGKLPDSPIYTVVVKDDLPRWFKDSFQVPLDDIKKIKLPEGAVKKIKKATPSLPEYSIIWVDDKGDHHKSYRSIPTEIKTLWYVTSRHAQSLYAKHLTEGEAIVCVDRWGTRGKKFLTLYPHAKNQNDLRNEVDRRLKDKLPKFTDIEKMAVKLGAHSDNGGPCSRLALDPSLLKDPTLRAILEVDKVELQEKLRLHNSLSDVSVAQGVVDYMEKFYPLAWKPHWSRAKSQDEYMRKHNAAYINMVYEARQKGTL